MRFLEMNCRRNQPSERPDVTPRSQGAQRPNTNSSETSITGAVMRVLQGSGVLGCSVMVQPVPGKRIKVQIGGMLHTPFQHDEYFAAEATPAIVAQWVAMTLRNREGATP